MTRYRWRMTQEGMVVFTDPPAIVDERAPLLDSVGTALLSAIEVEWGEECRRKATQWNVPDGWLQAMIYRESGGKPGALRTEGNGWVGVGLLQITHPSLKGARRILVDGKAKWVGARPDAEIALPSTNIYIGAKYIKELIGKYGKDFPAVSAAFNHGSVSPSPANPWGMVSTGNHISEEVAALNTWIKLRREALEMTTARTFIDLTELARSADDDARKDTEPPPPDAA